MLCALRLFLAAASAGAVDFGLVVVQDAKIETGSGSGSEISDAGETPDPAAFAYTPVLSLWFSASPGKRFSLYLSGRIGFEFAKEGDRSAWRDPAALPELDRSEITWLVSPALYLKLGRQHFADPAGFAASGLFDGLGADLSLRESRFSAGVYYTGLLYKDRADIIMTGRDQEEYLKPLALDESYFASRRLLAALGWEKPGIGPRSSLALALLAQFDCNGDEKTLHSQYLSARYGLRLPAGFGLEGTAALGLGEAPGDRGLFFAGALALNWMPPGGWDDNLSLRGIYSSPSYGDALMPFVPVNSLPQGQVFSPAIGGVSLVRGSYNLQPFRSLSVGAECSYFIRTDTVSFTDNQDPDKLKGEGYFLGGELYGTVRWTVLPDLALNIGGGVFFPGLGNAFVPEAKIQWNATLRLILAL
jgi:hypothetical protein